MQSTALRLLIGLLVLSALGFGVLLILTREQPLEAPVPSTPTPEEVPVAVQQPVRTVVGTSVEGRPIEAYTYGNGITHLLFVGGIHGGYEWNSVFLAYTFIDYLETNPNVIPEGVRVTVIPSANPDGLYSVVGKDGRFTVADVPDSVTTPGLGRLNAHGVDLNRNFDCKWKPEAVWRGTPVSAGTAPFSEPEALAIKNFITTQNPAAVVFWHSKSNAVYASECEAGILPGTRTLMNTYAQASGYPPVDSFNAYPVTGDAEGWLASIGIPAVTVELSTHETMEWEKNLAGINAVLTLYATRP